MMGCSAIGHGFISINGENSGLISGHAYSLIDIIEIPWSRVNNFYTLYYYV